MAQIIAIHSFMRGTGRSNITASVSSILAAKGQRVGVIDIDILSPSIHYLFGLNDSQISYSLNDYLLGKCRIEQATQDVTYRLEGKVSGKIFLIPSSIKASEIAGVLRTGYTLDLLLDAFNHLIDTLKLDILMVDTSAGLNEDSLFVMAACTALALVLRLDKQDYQGTAVTLEVAKRLGVPRIFLVVNHMAMFFDPEQVRLRLEKTYNCEVAAVLPHAQEMLALASTDIFAIRYPDHPITASFQHIAERLSG